MEKLDITYEGLVRDLKTSVVSKFWITPSSPAEYLTCNYKRNIHGQFFCHLIVLLLKCIGELGSLEPWNKNNKHHSMIYPLKDVSCWIQQNLTYGLILCIIFSQIRNNKKNQPHWEEETQKHALNLI